MYSIRNVHLKDKFIFLAMQDTKFKHNSNNNIYIYIFALVLVCKNVLRSHKNMIMATKISRRLIFHKLNVKKTEKYLNNN